MNLGAFEGYIDEIYKAEDITLNDLPIDMKKIAESIFGATLKICNGFDKNLESSVCFNSNECFVFFNDELSEDKTNILISHELTHYILCHKTESQKHYKKKMRHSACSIEIQTEKFSKALMMPRYLILQMKNLNYSKKQIIEKFGLSNYKEIAEKRFKDLNVFQEKPDINKQISKLEKSLKTEYAEIDLPYYSKNQHAELILNRKSKQNIRINKILSKDVDFVTDLSGMEIEGKEQPESIFGFINTKYQYAEADLLLLSKDFKLSVGRKIEKGYKVLGKIINCFKIPKPVIIQLQEQTSQLSLFTH